MQKCRFLLWRSPTKSHWKLAPSQELSLKLNALGAFFELISSTRLLGFFVSFLVGFFLLGSNARGDEKPNEDNHPRLSFGCLIRRKVILFR